MAQSAFRRENTGSREGRVFGYNDLSEKGAYDAAAELMREEGYTWQQAVSVVTTEVFGAGDGLTVESMATCRDLSGLPIPGVTGNDSPSMRTDEFASTEDTRRLMADLGVDETGKFILNHDLKSFIKLHGKKLVGAAIVFRVDKEFPLDKVREDDFPWEKLRDRLQNVINERLKKKKRRT